MGQKFYFDKRNPHIFTHDNGAIGYGLNSPFDCLGPYAKVSNCPIVCEGLEGLRLTAYATGYANTFFSVPACTRYKGVHIGGYFTNTENGIEFRVFDRFKEKLKALQNKGA